MSYASAPKETDTFVPEGEYGPTWPHESAPRRFSFSYDPVSGPHGFRWFGGTYISYRRELPDSLGPAFVMFYRSPAGHGETWSAPCAWMAAVQSVLDVRPALHRASPVDAQDRLRTLRLRAQEKGLRVILWREDTSEEAAEREATHDAMSLLQADSLFERG
jgi:hypothetical protein